MLNYQWSFNLPVREKTVRQRLDDFLKQQGFQIEHEDADKVQYRRGSAAFNYLAMNPRSWHSLATVHFKVNYEAVDVTILYQIDTTGQMMLTKERTFFDTEFASLVAFLQSGELDNRLAQNEKSAVRSNFFLALGFAVFIVLLLGIFLIPAWICNC